jgi:hypothetical protein
VVVQHAAPPTARSRPDDEPAQPHPWLFSTPHLPLLDPDLTTRAQPHPWLLDIPHLPALDLDPTTNPLSPTRGCSARRTSHCSIPT